ncbi:hypothetical protein [Corallococcus macrosporus]|nr:hypothetical protein [Corallococcus macrosporus]
MQGLVACARKVAGLIGAQDVPDAELSGFVESILFGEKDAWQCAVMGLITREETANLLLAHLETWLMSRANLDCLEPMPWDLEPLRHEFEDALFG